MSIIAEDGVKRVRMAYLAVVGSHKVNGVAALHTRLLQETILRDFYEVWPEKFTNKTNGITPPALAAPGEPRVVEADLRHAGPQDLLQPGRPAPAGAACR